MIDKLELNNLPFVDGVPDVDQKRIQWIRNGDCMTAASTKYGNDGNLNAAALGVQKNVEALEVNSEKTKTKINEVIDNVDILNEALAVTGDVSVIQQIQTNKENIEILQVHVQFAEENIGELYTDTEFLKENLGVYDPLEDPYYRPVRQDISWIKHEMGQYPGQDINGFPDVNAQATGMKRRIIDNSTAIVDNRVRIDKLEKDYSDSDVGSLSIKVNELREEVGVRPNPLGDSLYVRVDKLETFADVSDDTLTEIKEAIGLGTSAKITDRMSVAEGKISSLETTVNTPITGTVARITAVETAIGTASDLPSINGRLGKLREDMTVQQGLVGADSSSGLRGQMAWVQQRIGSEVSPASGTLIAQLNDVQRQANETASTVQDIQAEIGTNSTGLKGSILTLTTQMNGTNPTNGTTVEERGVLPTVIVLDQAISTKLSDAPSDGKMYARQDALWVEVPASISDIATIKTDVDGLKVADSENKARIVVLESYDIPAIKSESAASVISITELKAAQAATDLKTAEISPLTTRVGVLETDSTAEKLKVSTLETDLAAEKLKVADLETLVASLPPAAPSTSDGIAYVLVNGAWAPLSNYVP